VTTKKWVPISQAYADIATQRDQARYDLRVIAVGNLSLRNMAQPPRGSITSDPEIGP
jgi:hypothetical protein